MSHPAWHSTVWQTYDYDLDVNGAYYGSRKGCEPLHIQADPENWRVVAVNHTTVPHKGVRLSASLFTTKGAPIGYPITQRVDLPASDVATAFEAPTPRGAPALHLVRLEMRDAKGNELSTNTYWRYTDPSDMRALTALPATRIALAVGRSTNAGGRTTRTMTVANRGKTVAPMVRLGVRNRWNKRILPAEYSDNYFWLLPGESRTVTATWPTSAGAARTTAEAYNAARVQV